MYGKPTSNISRQNKDRKKEHAICRLLLVLFAVLLMIRWWIYYYIVVDSINHIVPYYENAFVSNCINKNKKTEKGCVRLFTVPWLCRWVRKIHRTCAHTRGTSEKCLSDVVSTAFGHFWHSDASILSDLMWHRHSSKHSRQYLRQHYPSPNGRALLSHSLYVLFTCVLYYCTLISRVIVFLNDSSNIGNSNNNNNFRQPTVDPMLLLHKAMLM